MQPQERRPGSQTVREFIVELIWSVLKRLSNPPSDAAAAPGVRHRTLKHKSGESPFPVHGCASQGAHVVMQTSRGGSHGGGVGGFRQRRLAHLRELLVSKVCLGHRGDGVHRDPKAGTAGAVEPARSPAALSRGVHESRQNRVTRRYVLGACSGACIRPRLRGGYVSRARVQQWRRNREQPGSERRGEIRSTSAGSLIPEKHGGNRRRAQGLSRALARVPPRRRRGRTRRDGRRIQRRVGAPVVGRGVESSEQSAGERVQRCRALVQRPLRVGAGVRVDTIRERREKRRGTPSGPTVAHLRGRSSLHGGVRRLQRLARSHRGLAKQLERFSDFLSAAAFQLVSLGGLVMDLSHAEERRDHLAVLQNSFSLRRGEEVVHPSSLDEPLQEHVVTPGLLVQVHLHRGSRAGRTGPVLGKRVDDSPAVGREGGGGYNLRRSGGVEGAGERTRRAKPEPSLGGNPAAATCVRGKLGAYRSLRLGGIDVDRRDGYVHGGQRRRRLRLHLPLNLSRRRRGIRRRRGVGNHPHELRQHEPAPDRGCCRGRHDASTSRRRVVHEHLFAESLVREERRAAAGGDDERCIRRRATRENGSTASRTPAAARDGSRGGNRGCQDGERVTSRAQLGAVERPTPTLRREHDDGGANPGSWRGGGGDELDVPLCSQRPHHGTQRAVGDDQRVTSAPVAVHLPLLQASTGKRYEPRRVAPALRGSRPRERPDGILVGIRRVHREGIGEEAQRSLRRRHGRRTPLGRGVN
mmetsp:Transcript_4814/g.19798  ORF Transcript_4814/g.19798 Transcript_4814/m.19798 type:complete len:752 (-) Transcript_4814:679-2934(-)